MIDTIDSYELARVVDKRTQKRFNILVEVNATNEKNKHGVKVEEVTKLLRKIKQLKNINC